MTSESIREEYLSLSGFRLSLELISFNSFSDICFSTLRILCLVFSPRLPGPLVFSLTFPCEVTNSLLDRLVGKLTGLGVIMFV